MKIKNKTTRTFDIKDVTENQAQDFLSISLKVDKGEVPSLSELETLNTLRQALLSAGITNRGD